MNKIKTNLLNVKNFIFDSSINIQDRSFMLFSCLVLISLYAAVPCGIVMKEPLTATISTLVGAVVFTIFVFYVFKKNKIAKAKIVLSVIVVVIFLPAMFFTNGGAMGGAPIWLLLGMVYTALILEGKVRAIMLSLNAAIMITCWIIGYKFPQFVTEYSRGGNYFDAIAGLFIVGGIIYTLIVFHISLFRNEEQSKNLRRLFEQTATALVNAIDAKDEYTHGHSSRVAEYSRKIAAQAGKTPEECDEIYYIALLHDVGKIGIAESIINKKGKLTEEEYNVIKQHPVFGARILRSITEYPDFLIGARNHHERYDGRGYPDRLKGDDIPEIARIISVADAYDAMTSKRSYRDPIPQQSVREEIVKGAGTQFDPKFAKIMQHLIDMDTEYEMKEKCSVEELAGKSELICNSFGNEISTGILIGPAPQIKKIRLKCDVLDRKMGKCAPLMVLFDSLDGRYHQTPRNVEELNYFEYARLHFDGEYECKGARKIAVERGPSNRKEKPTPATRGILVYDLETVKVKDHVLMKIDDGIEVVTITIALPDSARWVYIGLTGENCLLYDVGITTEKPYVPGDYIPRIAEEINYISGPSGDIPNIQIDGYRIDSTLGIPVRDGMKITFHTMSLPTARLVWHTAYLDLFYSSTRKPEGDDYKEYALIRLDGENWEAEGIASNKLVVNIGDDFEGWDAWKAANKEGFDCTVSFKRDDKQIITTTENLGISLRVTTTILDDPLDVYVSLTGDQCAITNIRIEGAEE